MELVRAHAFLRRGHEVESGQPFVERNMRTLHHGASHDAEIGAALRLRAAINAGAAGGVGLEGAALAADGAGRPADRLHVLAGRVIVLEVGSVESVHGVTCLMPPY